MEIIGANRVVIAFGSNLEPKEAHIQNAIEAISSSCGHVSQVSPFYYSEPVGFESKHNFINGCLLLLTNLSPIELLHKLQSIEKKMGRIKEKPHYEDRCIDLDIIFYESLCLDTDELQIPHPRYHERDFVLIPLQALNLDTNPFKPSI